MAKLKQNDLRYDVLARIPRVTDGQVRLRTISGNFLLALIQIDTILIKVLYKYNTNILGEMCVSFEHSVV